MKVYLVKEENVDCDIHGVFSTIEQARERIDYIYSRKVGKGMLIIEYVIDDPYHEIYVEEYERHGDEKKPYAE